jgi:type VII secretion-associated protein (TIGR03931 family)
VSADPVVVLVGPATTRGRHDVPDDLDSEALFCIDDALALVDDRVVSVDTLWSQVLRRAVGDDADAVLLVVPSWWTATRIHRITAAAERTYPDVTVLTRRDILCGNDTGVLVEIATELVVIHRAGSPAELVPRSGDPCDVVHTVLERLRGALSVVVDSPSRVPAAELVDDVIRGLQQTAVPVRVCNDDALEVAARVEYTRRCRSSARRWPPRPPRPRTVAAAAVVLSVSVLAVAGLRTGPEPSRQVPLTWLVEGHVAVEVPADWRTERIVVGPGSARVQVMSPTDPRQAIHVTQSPIPQGQSLASAAEVVRVALNEQPEGVFAGFDPAARVADEPAITYRETRADRVVDWTIVLDGGVRIAIGCQGAADIAAPHGDCEHAIRSAHEWRRNAFVANGTDQIPAASNP